MEYRTPFRFGKEKTNRVHLGVVHGTGICITTGTERILINLYIQSFIHSFEIWQHDLGQGPEASGVVTF